MTAGRPPGTIADALAAHRGRAPNFDAIRLFAAILVVFSHAFIVSTGRHEREFLPSAAGGPGVGEIAVFIFFATSGFLVTRSWMAAPAAPEFLLKRALRIFPALAFAVLALALVAGPVLTAAPLADYFSAAETWRFLLNIVFCSQFGTLPGVFEAAPFAGRVDQPMWTLGFEAVCYGLIAALGAARLLGVNRLLALALVCFAINPIPGLRDLGAAGDALFKATMLTPHFLIGAAAALAADRITLNARYAAAAASALALSFLFGGFLQVFAIAGTYLILWLAFAPLGPVAAAGKWGDFSYGVFLWGWPIQQLVEISAPQTGPVANFIIALPLAFLAAAVSWRFIERPALALKPRDPAPKRSAGQAAGELAA